MVFSFVEAMFREATDLGVRFYPVYELMSLTEPPSAATLAAQAAALPTGWAPRFELDFGANGRVLSEVYIANMMQQPLLQVLQRSSLSFAPPADDGARGEGEAALYLTHPNIACKYYVHYENAWWRGLNDQDGAPLDNAFGDGWGSGSYRQDAPDGMSVALVGRYHDGHARCRPDGSCYGFLLVTYTAYRGSGTNNCHVFEKLQVSYDPPVTTFTPDTRTGRWLLQHTHERLMAYHASQNVTLPPAVLATPPTIGVLSLWVRRAEPGPRCLGSARSRERAACGRRLGPWSSTMQGSCT